jgi:sRNA-binding carbon storage regulator CsrA
MLVLKREKNQTIVVNGPCVITIGELGARHVKVLLDGPPTTKFLRGELVPPPPPALNEATPQKRAP